MGDTWSSKIPDKRSPDVGGLSLLLSLLNSHTHARMGVAVGREQTGRALISRHISPGRQRKEIATCDQPPFVRPGREGRKKGIP